MSHLIDLRPAADMGRFDFRTESARTIPRAAGAAARKDANKPQAAVEQHEQIGTINEKAPRKIHEDGRVEISELDAPNVLGTAFSTKKKWTILSVIFLVQCSMNMNASIYSSGVGHLQDKFGISAQGARAGQLAFLIAYGFGCEVRVRLLTSAVWLTTLALGPMVRGAGTMAGPAAVSVLRQPYVI